MTEKITVDREIIENLVKKTDFEATADTNDWNITNPAWVDGYKEGILQAVNAVMGPSYLENIHELAEELQPQLNPNQQTVLDWLKESCKLNGLRTVIAIMGFLSTTGGKTKFKQVAYAYDDLNDDELKQVLQAFSRWAIEQEEE